MKNTKTAAANLRLGWANSAWVLLALSIAVALAYSNSTDVPFLFDDVHNIKNNANIHISKLTPLSLAQSTLGNPTPRPVAYLTFALNHAFDQLNVRSYHWVNLSIHTINGLLVFLVSLQLLRALDSAKTPERYRPQPQHRYWIALFAALMFVLHPVQTQSVTYIVQRMTSLCAVFYFAGILAYLRIRGGDRRQRILGGLLIAVLWLLALGTKQVAVTLPLAILLIEWLFFQLDNRKWLSTGMKYLGITLVLMGLTAFAFRGPGLFRLFTRGYLQRDFTLVERLLTEGRVVLHYLSLAFWPLPSRLSLIYDFPVSRSLVQPLTTLGAWMVITLSLGMAFKTAGRYRVLAFAILWFFLHLVVESTVIPLELVYEHRLYLPLYGVCLAVAFYAFAGLRELRVAIPVMAAIVVLLGVGSYHRNQTWRSEYEFWQDNIAKQPGAARCHFNLGAWHASHQQYQRAFHAYQKSIELAPRLQLGYIHLGHLFELRGDYEQALELYDHALSVPRVDVRGLRPVVDALIARGRTLQALNRLEEAVTTLNEAVVENPSHHLSYFFRAGVQAKIDRPQEAIADYRTCLDLRPDFINANNNLAWLLATHPDLAVSNPESAVQYARIACELTDWKNSTTLATLAAAYARNGDFHNAVRWQTESAQLANPPAKERMTQRLQLFRSKQPMIQQK